MERIDLLLAGSLYVPVAVTVALWLWRPPSRRARAGILFAFAWCMVSLLPVHAAAMRFHWWSFDATGPSLFGFPIELLVGWALLWSAIPALVFPRARLSALATAMLLLDLVAMPLLAPALRLGPTWLVGELIALALCLIPAQLLYRWTRDDTHLPARAILLCASFSVIMLGILPTVILAHTGGDWNALFSRPSWVISLSLQLLAIPAALGASAVQEFVLRGGGTPVPFDATKRLVTSGAYAYVSNPDATREFRDPAGTRRAARELVARRRRRHVRDLQRRPRRLGRTARPRRAIRRTVARISPRGARVDPSLAPLCDAGPPRGALCVG